MSLFGRPEDRHAHAHDVQPVHHELLTVERSTLQNLYEHLNYVYDRFPTRRLRQSILITRHMLYDERQQR